MPLKLKNMYLSMLFVNIGLICSMLKTVFKIHNKLIVNRFYHHMGYNALLCLNHNEESTELYLSGSVKVVFGPQLGFTGP
jgi:hypothetical protein